MSLPKRVASVGAIDVDKMELSDRYRLVFQKPHISYQFSINHDDSFEIQWAGLKYVDENGKEQEREYNYISMPTILRAIYNNEPALI